MISTFAGTAISTWGISFLNWKKTDRRDREREEKEVSKLQDEAEKRANNVEFEIIKYPTDKADWVFAEALTEVAPGQYKSKMREALWRIEQENPYSSPATRYLGRYMLRNKGTGVAKDVELSGVDVVGEKIFDEIMPQSYKPIILVFGYAPDGEEWWPVVEPNPDKEITISYSSQNGTKGNEKHMVSPLDQGVYPGVA